MKQNTENKILETLRVQTVTFKQTYLDKVREYIQNDIKFILDTYGEYTSQQFESEFGYSHNVGRRTFIKLNEVGTKLRDKTIKYKQLRQHNRLDIYIENQIQLNSEDFDNKLMKLASRLSEKGFTESVVIESNHVGVNFECLLREENKLVRAYTIIASGPVIKPHYRYLIK